MNKAKFLLSVICYLSSVVTLTSIAEPIPVDDLFRWPDTYSYKLNPSSKFFAKHFFRGKNYNVIEIHDLKSNRVADAFRIKVKKHAHIKEYYWVDEDTLYISYSLGRNDNRRIFLDIDFDIFQNSEDEIAKIIRIESKAIVIDPLVYQDNKILVQQSHQGKIAVYETTPGRLAEDSFEEKESFGKHLDSAINYFTGKNGKIKFAAVLENEKVQFWYLENYDDKWEKLFEFGEFDFDFEPVAIINKNTMVVITNKETDKKALVEFNFLTKKLGKTIYQHDKYDLLGASISSETGKLLSVSFFDHGHLTTKFFSSGNKQLDYKIRKQFPLKQYFIYSRHPDSTIMILYVFSSDDPGRYYWFDSAESKFVKLSASHSYLDKFKFSQTEIFSIKSKNDVEIEAILTKSSKSNGVLLVSPHGGPIGVRHLDEFSPSNQFYASRGYSILNVNFRGSSGYGKKFLSEGIGQFGKKIEEDITLAVSSVRSKYSFNKLCSIGASYGGYSSLILAAYHPKEYECAIGAYGVYDLPLLFNTSNIQMSEENIKVITNTVGENNDSLKDFSPIYLAEKIMSPVLLIAGEEDFVASFEQSNRMKYRLKHLNKDIETMFYADTGHGHEGFKWDKHEHLIIEDFIKRKLNIKESSNIVKKIRGDEAMIIADAYEFKDIVKDDKEKAFKHYQIAAKNGHPRGLYNLASFYQRGVGVKKNMSKAISLYKESSVKEYQDASFRLGFLYRKGVLIEQDYKESVKYYRLAEKQGHEKAGYQLTYSNCMGWGIQRNMNECIEYIDKKLTKDRESPMAIIRDILFQSTLNVEESNDIKKLLLKFDYVNILDKKQFQLNDFGHYKFISGFNEFRNTSSNTKLEISNDDKLGLSFMLKNENNLTKNKRAIVKLTWNHPSIPEREGKPSEFKSEQLNWMPFNQNITLFHTFEKQIEKVDGIWKVEIHNLENKLLFMKEFDLEFE